LLDVRVWKAVVHTTQRGLFIVKGREKSKKGIRRSLKWKKTEKKGGNPEEKLFMRVSRSGEAGPTYPELALAVGVRRSMVGKGWKKRDYERGKA